MDFVGGIVFIFFTILVSDATVENCLLSIDASVHDVSAVTVAIDATVVRSESR